MDGSAEPPTAECCQPLGGLEAWQSCVVDAPTHLLWLRVLPVCGIYLARGGANGQECTRLRGRSRVNRANRGRPCRRRLAAGRWVHCWAVRCTQYRGSCFRVAQGSCNTAPTFSAHHVPLHPRLFDQMPVRRAQSRLSGTNVALARRRRTEACASSRIGCDLSDPGGWIFLSMTEMVWRRWFSTTMTDVTVRLQERKRAELHTITKNV